VGVTGWVGNGVGVAVGGNHTIVGVEVGVAVGVEVSSSSGAGVAAGRQALNNIVLRSTPK